MIASEQVSNKNNIAVIKCKYLYSTAFVATDDIQTESPGSSRVYVMTNMALFNKVG